MAQFDTEALVFRCACGWPSRTMSDGSWQENAFTCQACDLRVLVPESEMRLMACAQAALGEVDRIREASRRVPARPAVMRRRRSFSWLWR